MPKQILLKTKFDYIFWLKVVLFTTIISTIRLVFFPIEIALGNIIAVIGMSIFFEFGYFWGERKILLNKKISSIILKRFFYGFIILIFIEV